MSNNDLRYWLALNATGRFTGWHLHRLRSHFDSLEAVFNASPPTLYQAGLTEKQTLAIKSFRLNRITADLDWAEQTAQHIITLDDANYPTLLKQISDPPLVLYVAGDPDLLNYPQLAMVGSRKPTPAGLKAAQHFANELSQQGLIITSGMALGIDTACHQGALQTEGYSIAILGTGINKVYPRRNAKLYQMLKSQGALVSEFPLNTSPIRVNFPRRNRLISGLSLGTFVIEAAIASGSLVTAKLAAEQGREVFALPGSIYNQQSKGCHNLLKNGACLVESSEDILAQLAPFLSTHYPNLIKAQPLTPSISANFLQEKLDFKQLDKDHRALLNYIGDEPVAINTLIAQTRFTANQVSAMLVELELQGLLQATHGGYCRVR